MKAFQISIIFCSLYLVFLHESCRVGLVKIHYHDTRTLSELKFYGDTVNSCDLVQNISKLFHAASGHIKF
jgi:hypothetical protein